jgi:hypothetical protein
MEADGRMETLASGDELQGDPFGRPIRPTPSTPFKNLLAALASPPGSRLPFSGPGGLSIAAKKRVTVLGRLTIDGRIVPHGVV